MLSKFQTMRKGIKLSDYVSQVHQIIHFPFTQFPLPRSLMLFIWACLPIIHYILRFFHDFYKNLHYNHFYKNLCHQIYDSHGTKSILCSVISSHVLFFFTMLVSGMLNAHIPHIAVLSLVWIFIRLPCCMYSIFMILTQNCQQCDRRFNCGGYGSVPSICYWWSW